MALSAVVVDDAGRVLDSCDLGDDAYGYAYLSALLAERAAGPYSVAIASDGDRRLVPRLLMTAGWALAVVDEASVADYAQRFADPLNSRSADTDTPRHALGLALALQAGALSATLQPTPPELVELKPVLAALRAGHRRHRRDSGGKCCGAVPGRVAGATERLTRPRWRCSAPCGAEVLDAVELTPEAVIDRAVGPVRTRRGAGGQRAAGAIAKPSARRAPGMAGTVAEAVSRRWRRFGPTTRPASGADVGRQVTGGSRSWLPRTTCWPGGSGSTIGRPRRAHRSPAPGTLRSRGRCPLPPRPTPRRCRPRAEPPPPRIRSPASLRPPVRRQPVAATPGGRYPHHRLHRPGSPRSSTSRRQGVPIEQRASAPAPAGKPDRAAPGNRRPGHRPMTSGRCPRGVGFDAPVDSAPAAGIGRPESGPRDRHRQDQPSLRLVEPTLPEELRDDYQRPHPAGGTVAAGGGGSRQ